VETLEYRGDAVRCVACHTVYEHAPPAPENEENGVCPTCGDAGWLALTIPVEKTEAALLP
jgi:rRNA maturation endonuclease Nob1